MKESPIACAFASCQPSFLPQFVSSARLDKYTSRFTSVFCSEPASQVFRGRDACDDRIYEGPQIYGVAVVELKRYEARTIGCTLDPQSPMQASGLRAIFFFYLWTFQLQPIPHVLKHSPDPLAPLTRIGADLHPCGFKGTKWKAQSVEPGGLRKP